LYAITASTGTNVPVLHSTEFCEVSSSQTVLYGVQHVILRPFM